MEKLTLIKVGGKIVEEQATLSRLLASFAAIPGRKVLVLSLIHISEPTRH